LLARLELVLVIEFCDSRGVPGAAIGTQIAGGFSKKFEYSTAEDALWRAGTSGRRPACVEEVGPGPANCMTDRGFWAEVRLAEKP
jgi:hypothetical protein